MNATVVAGNYEKDRQDIYRKKKAVAKKFQNKKEKIFI
jgi:hypothetical protein